MALEQITRRQGDNADPARPPDFPPSERKLIVAMRRKIRENGSRVEFKEDRNGDLIAVEKVLHRASDFT